MAEIAIIGPVLGKLSDFLLPPVKRRFSYVLRYKTKIEDLRRKVKELQLKQSDVQSSVDVAKRNLEAIKKEVEKWLEDVEKVRIEANGFLEEFSRVETNCINGLCPNLKTRYVLGKRATRIKERVLKLKDEGKFEQVSLPAPPVSVDFGSRAGKEFGSRISIEEKIMDALKDDNADIIGIYGMGGVGKTTMANRIGKRVQEESLFNQVVIVTISQKPDVGNVQVAIAEQLGLTLTEQTLLVRATKLDERLKKEQKILIILDDLWERLNLREIGIPTHKGCKILLTSRDRDVCNRMISSEKNIFMIDSLSEEEALNLFDEHSKYTDDMKNLSPVAQQIAEECKGLPIALVTVGSALKGKELHFWINALDELRRALPENIPGVIKDVYRKLEFSYTNLESEEAKSLFLICCLYPEDFIIPIAELNRYVMGLQMFKSVASMEQARNKVRVLVDILKDRCLLIEVYEGMGVKMHDVIRDVAIYIASQDKKTHMICHNEDFRTIRSGVESYTCMSLVSATTAVRLPSGLNFPNLELLLSRGKMLKLESLVDIFNESTKLQVLDIEGISLIPSKIELLMNLHTLQLTRISSLVDISVIGNLVNLKVLSFSQSGISRLPKELGALVGLRVLDLSWCLSLERIAPGVIQNLVKLEELYMLASFRNWATGKAGEVNENAALTELESLTNLTTLEVEIPSHELIPKNMLMVLNLNRYFLFIGERMFYFYQQKGKFEKKITLGIPTMSPLDEGLRLMLKSTKSLQLEGDGAKNAMNELFPQGFRHLYRLEISRCSTMEHLGSTSDCTSLVSGVFPALLSLKLEEVQLLKEIWHGQLPEGSFQELRHIEISRSGSLMLLWSGPTTCDLVNLKTLRLSFCDSLENVFSLSTVEVLPQLAELKIENCKELKEVFSVESRANSSVSNKIVFKKLRELTLRNLPSLRSFCNGNGGIEPGRMDVSLEGIDDTNRCCLFNQNVSLPRLKTLNLKSASSIKEIFSSKVQDGSFLELEKMVVNDCYNLRSLLYPMVRKLVNLEELEITGCREMTEIVAKKDVEEVQVDERLLMFPSMKTLTIDGTIDHLSHFFKVFFPRLKTLTLVSTSLQDEICCSKVQDDFFLKLEKMVVKDCNNLRSLFSPSVVRNLINLKELSIDGYHSMTEIVAKNEEEEEQGDETLLMFPSMEALYISSCTSIKSLAGCFFSVSFTRLKKLVLYKLDFLEEIWCSEIKELQFLEVTNCHNLRSLFPYSAAKQRVKLETLKVSDCMMMTEIIEKGEGEDLELEEKLNSTCFPQLKKIDMLLVESLAMFCHVEHEIELPSLNDLSIWGCYKMRTFSLGAVSTPNLKKIYFDYGEDIETTNVNDTIRHFFIEKAKKNGNVGPSSTNDV